MLSYLYWDPPREMFPFNLPLIDRPILWYGFFFALGFFLAYEVVRRQLAQDLKDKPLAKSLAEKLTVYVAIGALVGARLGDVIFYQSWKETLSDPLSIMRVWEGGLASHGGALGILAALGVYAWRHKRFSYLSLLDLVAAPTALAASFIRIGNFFNQEILGTATHLPWGVIFGHPADGSASVPRHPVQLYESIYYFAVFLILLKGGRRLKKKGAKIGLFLVLVFTFRFFIEYVKMEQSAFMPADSWLTMGQLLSIPFILLGVILMRRR